MDRDGTDDQDIKNQLYCSLKNSGIINNVKVNLRAVWLSLVKDIAIDR